jgi:protoporphyrinogen/coproporphyrinogen III oxidase
VRGVAAERHVVVVGGGIAGLAAAHALLTQGRTGEGPPPRITLLEAEQRLGGQVRSEPIASRLLDVGAESLMTRTPAAIELCRELGLEQELVAPRQSAMFIWARGRLRPLPPGILGGMPQGTWPLLRSGILSPAGVARAALDLLLPASEIDEDCSVAELVRPRLGSQVLDRLIDPLLGTIYAADCESLSAQSTAPQILKAAGESRSLIRGLRIAAGAQRGSPAGGRRDEGAGKRGQPSGGPPFVSLPGGLGRIVERLVESLDAAELRRGVRADRLERSADGRYLLSVSGGERLLCDGLVLATPAGQTASVLDELCAPAAARLRTIDYASTVIVTMRYPGSATPRPLEWAGMMVPRSERRLLGALTAMSAKWPHLAADGEIWLRCSVTRKSAVAALELEDAEIVGRLAAELREALGLRGEPLQAHVTRWRRSLPLYEPGHSRRVAEIEAHLRRLPALVLAGAAYKGIGVPQCIQQGREAAQRVLSELQDPAGRSQDPHSAGALAGTTTGGQ